MYILYIILQHFLSSLKWSEKFCAIGWNTFVVETHWAELMTSKWILYGCFAVYIMCNQQIKEQFGSCSTLDLFVNPMLLNVPSQNFNRLLHPIHININWFRSKGWHYISQSNQIIRFPFSTVKRDMKLFTRKGNFWNMQLLIMRNQH